eukprot:149731_1
MASFLLSLLMIYAFNVDSYKDGEVSEMSSPPFLQVALDSYSHPEIVSLLQDPDHYEPWGKSGIAYSIIYYVRNARLAVQYYNNPMSLIIGDDNHREIWARMFALEMDIFTAFKHW